MRKRQACLFEKCMRREIMVNYCTKNANGPTIALQGTDSPNCIANDIRFSSLYFHVCSGLIRRNGIAHLNTNQRRNQINKKNEQKFFWNAHSLTHARTFTFARLILKLTHKWKYVRARAHAYTFGTCTVCTRQVSGNKFTHKNTLANKKRINSQGREKRIMLLCSESEQKKNTPE